LPDSADQLVVEDAPIFGAGRRTEFMPAIVQFKDFDLLGAVVGQPVLEIDAGKLRRHITQVTSRRTDQAA